MAGLKVKRKKHDFIKNELHYLDHMISKRGIYPLPEKLQSVEDFPILEMPKEMRQMLDLTGYCHKFISAYADLRHSLCTKLFHSYGQINVTSI